jgi:hypothetical protein
VCVCVRVVNVYQFAYLCEILIYIQFYILMAVVTSLGGVIFSACCNICTMADIFHFLQISPRKIDAHAPEVLAAVPSPSQSQVVCGPYSKSQVARGPYRWGQVSQVASGPLGGRLRPAPPGSVMYTGRLS